jgi:hypothetical protein
MTGNESRGYPHADRDVVNAAVQQIRRQTKAGLFVEFDDGHDVWALILYPRLVVDGERVDATVSGHDLWRTLVTAAHRAVACGRLHIVIAVSAALNPESAVGPACPKELCVRVVGRSEAVDEWIVKNSSRRHLATVGHHPPIRVIYIYDGIADGFYRAMPRLVPTAPPALCCACAVWRSGARSQEGVRQLAVTRHGVLAVGGEDLNPDVVRARLEVGAQARNDAVGRALSGW